MSAFDRRDRSISLAGGRRTEFLWNGLNFLVIGVKSRLAKLFRGVWRDLLCAELFVLNKSNFKCEGVIRTL